MKVTNNKIMEFIRTLREKQKTSRQNDIIQEAHDTIHLDDFDGKIFIFCKGTPLIPMENTFTSEEIFTKLDNVRKGYISYRMHQLDKTKSNIF